jgi:hypothetical protein
LTPLLVHPQLLKVEKPSRVVRYAFACSLLAEWTHDTLWGGALRAKEWKRAASMPSFVDSCDDEGDVEEVKEERVGGKACEWARSSARHAWRAGGEK